MTTERDALAPGQDAIDDARPNAEPAAAAPQEAVVSGPVDPDEAILAAAEAEVAAAERGQQAEPGQGEAPSASDTSALPPGPGTAAAPAQPPAAAPGTRPQQTPPPVPYARFQEVNRTAQQMRDQLLYQEGVIAALKAGNPGAAPAAPGAPAAPPAAAAAPAPTPQEQIAAHRAELRQAAKAFDAGEITQEALEDVRGRVDDAVASIREAARPQAQPQAPANAPQPGLADQAIMERQLAELGQAHPFAEALTEPQAQFLANQAIAEAVASGRPYGSTAADTLRLRQHVAQLSDFYGPRWGLQPTRPLQSPQQQRPGVPGALSPTAQARAGKLALANGLPPDTAAMGAGGGSEELSEAAIMAMSEDEIAALPRNVQDRIMRM